MLKAVVVRVEHMESADHGMDPFTRIQVQNMVKGVDQPCMAASKADYQSLAGANP